MKTVQYEAKKSIFSRFINALRNSILSDILVSEEAGQVITPDELDSESRVAKLAHDTNTTEADMWNYEKQFNAALASVDKLEKEVSKVPAEKKDSSNPFKVDESELSHDEPVISRVNSERETGDSEKDIEK